MRVRIDPSADAVYIDLAEREIASSEELAEGIIVDYDAEGRIVGVEILDASRKTGDDTTLQRFNLDYSRVAAV
jgi:YD repeat-containing protein